MGYTTEFKGVFKVAPELTEKHAEYLRAFSYVRHMKRITLDAEKLVDIRRVAVGLPVGLEGEYYVGSADDGNFGQGQWNKSDPTIIDYNTCPSRQPGLWCKWTPTADRTGIEWNGFEKFHGYIPWLIYLLENFLVHWGYIVNGEVYWEGENPEDTGVIRVRDGIVEVLTERVL